MKSRSIIYYCFQSPSVNNLGEVNARRNWQKLNKTKTDNQTRDRRMCAVGRQRSCLWARVHYIVLVDKRNRVHFCCCCCCVCVCVSFVLSDEHSPSKSENSWLTRVAHMTQRSNNAAATRISCPPLYTDDLFRWRWAATILNRCYGYGVWGPLRMHTFFHLHRFAASSSSRWTRKIDIRRWISPFFFQFFSLRSNGFRWIPTLSLVREFIFLSPFSWLHSLAVFPFNFNLSNDMFAEANEKSFDHGAACSTCARPRYLLQFQSGVQLILSVDWWNGRKLYVCINFDLFGKREQQECTGELGRQKKLVPLHWWMSSICANICDDFSPHKLQSLQLL